MGFDDLKPVAKDYITQLCGNVANGTHLTEILRLSGDVNDPRARILQKTAGDAPDHTIYLEGYAAGDAFQMLIVRGFIQGEWLDPDTWQGSVQDSALEEHKQQ